jgi:hypothetical protein
MEEYGRNGGAVIEKKMWKGWREEEGLGMKVK